MSVAGSVSSAQRREPGLGRESSEPTVLRMAAIASQRETLGLMIWICCLSVLWHVAGRAIRKYAVLPAYERFVAPFTFESGVRPEQRKEIVVIADLLLGSEPALYNVALRAIRAELAQVNVGMAIVAILADIGENRLRVALRAGKLFMTAAKRKVCLIVVEPGTIEDRAPPGSRMAILAGNRERAVRVWSRVLLSESDRRHGQQQKGAKQSSKNDKENACQRPGRSL